MKQPDPITPPQADATSQVRNDESPLDLARLISGGQPLDAVLLLSRHPQLALNKSLVLDLAYEEYCQRCERGEAVDSAKFCERFPAYQSSLRRLVEVHQYLKEDGPCAPERKPAEWPEPGRCFHGFTIVRELGRGAFSRVYLATQTSLGDRPVAVKVTWLETAEAHTLGRLTHPNIVPIHSVEVDGATGLTLICMPYLGSATLSDVLDALLAAPGLPRSAGLIRKAIQAQDPPPSAGGDSYVSAVIRIGIALADALAHVHSMGVYHRDVKPSNILMTPAGCPMLLDFNLAFDRRLDHGCFGGTLAYMAPEHIRATDPAAQADPASVNARSDLFSLGVILYELLAGEHPFGPIPLDVSRSAMRQFLLERQQRGPRPLDDLNPGVDRGLARAISTCLAFDPAQRPGSAAVLAAQLRRELRPHRQLQRWLTAHRVLAAGLAGLLGAAILLIGAWYSTRAPSWVREAEAGLARYRRGDHEAALVHFNRSLAQAPASAQTLAARGRTYQKLGEFSLALADFHAARKIVDDGRTRACIGYSLCQLGYYNQAIDYFEQAVQAGCVNAELLNNLGYCLLLQGKLDEAKEVLDRAVALDPNLQAAFYNRALVHLQRTLLRPGYRSAEAFADIQRAIALGPPGADLHRHAASLYALDGQDGLALDALEEAVKLGLDPAALESDPMLRPLHEHPQFKSLAAAGPGRQPARTPRLLDPVSDN